MATDTNPEESESLNEKTCFEYLEQTDGPHMLLGYMDATFDLTKDLGRILEKQQSFESLKKELLDYTVNRTQFAEFLAGQWNDDLFTFTEPVPPV